MKKKIKKITSVCMIFMLILCGVPMKQSLAAQSMSGNFNKSYSLGNNDADNMVAIAQAQLGKTKAQLGYTEAWCADFVSDCAKLAGINSKIPFNSSCYYMYNAVLNAGGTVVSTPQKGDLVFYYCTACSSVPWVHVGLMVNSTQSIEGNYGGAVSSVNGVYRDSNNHTVASGTVIRKFVRPAYNNTSEECNCSTGYAGNYTVTTTSLPLNIRNTHSTSGSVIGSIPKRTTVYVSKSNGTWAHVNYNGISGYCSMDYLTKEPVEYDIRIRYWFSNTKVGDSVSTCNTGDFVYLCYELYDAASGKQWNQLETKDYDVKLTIYGPDGSEKHTYTYEDSDYNWIGVKPDVGGQYTGKIEVTGDRTGSVQCTVNAIERKDVITDWISSDSAGNTEISMIEMGKTAYFRYKMYDENTGELVNQHRDWNYTVVQTVYDPDGNVISNKTLTKVDNNAIPVTVNKKGTYKQIVKLTFDNGSTNSWESTLEVKPNTYTISYYSNGGNLSAPSSQTKETGESVTLADYQGKLHSYVAFDTNGGAFSDGTTGKNVRYAREFILWNTKANGNGSYYLVEEEYDSDYNLTLYAQYSDTMKAVSTVSTPIREGYIFKGWTSGEDGSGYSVADDMSLNYNVSKVYGQWEAVPTPTPTPTPTPIPTNALNILTSTNYAKQGEVIPITISIQDNPGITSMTLDVNYDTNALTLKSVENANLLAGASFSTSNQLTTNPYRLVWNIGTQNSISNGKLVTLYFEVKKNAEEGTYPITVTALENDIFNTSLENVPFTCSNGGITIKNAFQPGDVNHDSIVNAKDATLINQYYAGWDVNIDLQTADVTGDGTINIKDATLILQYYAGWNVVLKEGKVNE